MANELNVSLAGLKAAVGAFLLRSDEAASKWTVPRAPGKWSPSQVSEHVARIMEESAKVAAGVPSKFPTLPLPVRPVVRLLMFKRILRRKSFLKTKALEALDPTEGAATPAVARDRLAGTLARFDEACRGRAASDEKVASTLFGKVAVADFARFQELHVRHHLEQIPSA